VDIEQNQNHQHDFDVTTFVGLRHKSLYEALLKFAPECSAQERVHIASIGTELANISSEAQRRWAVCSDADISQACFAIILAFDKIAVPYWERFSSLNEILATTSDDDASAWIHSPIDTTRAQTAITAAFVLGDKAEFEALVRRKIEYLKGKPKYELQAFTRLADQLSKSWPGQ